MSMEMEEIDSSAQLPAANICLWTVLCIGTCTRLRSSVIPCVLDAYDAMCARRVSVHSIYSFGNIHTAPDLCSCKPMLYALQAFSCKMLAPTSAVRHDTAMNLFDGKNCASTRNPVVVRACLYLELEASKIAIYAVEILVDRNLSGVACSQMGLANIARVNDIVLIFSLLATTLHPSVLSMLSQKLEKLV